MSGITMDGTRKRPRVFGETSRRVSPSAREYFITVVEIQFDIDSGGVFVGIGRSGWNAVSARAWYCTQRLERGESDA